MVSAPQAHLASLVAVLFCLGCTQPDTPPPATCSAMQLKQVNGCEDELIVPGELLDPPENAGETVLLHADLTDDDLFGREEMLYVECDEHDADTVFVMYVTVPGVMRAQPFALSLCRRKVRPLQQPFGSHIVCADGFQRSYIASWGLYEATDSSVEVSFQMSWRSSGSANGEFDVTLPVTIGTPFIEELDNGVVIRCVFEGPPEAPWRAAKPGAQVHGA